MNLNIPTSTLALQPEPLHVSPPRQLLTPLPTPGHFLLVIDNSSLEVFTTCPMSAYYKLVLKREAHARNAALTFGGALHEGLELFLHDQYSQQTGGVHNDFTRAAQKDLEDQRVLRFFTENPAPPDEYRTVTNALAVLSAYRQRAAMPDYAWNIQFDANGPLIERAFELPLGVIEVGAWIEAPWLSIDQIALNQEDWIRTYLSPLPIPVESNKVFVSQIHLAWSGRIDAIARCGPGEAVRVVDHKTTSIMGDQFLQDFQISNQVLGYVWAARQLWPDLSVSGFCLNAIHFKKPTGSGAITDPGPRGGPSALNFLRAYYDYSPQRVDEWASNCIAIVSDFIHCLVRDHFPRHTKWCFGKYGKCQYHDVCVQDDPKVRENMIRSDMFKTVTWNPVAGR